MAARLRKGMWAIYNDGVNSLTGIITDFREDLIEFHVVDPAGDTIGIRLVPACTLTQASLSSIPVPRRPVDERAKAFGYL